MPLCTLSLIVLHDRETIAASRAFVSDLQRAGERPILAGHFKRWIIKPELIDVETIRADLFVLRPNEGQEWPTALRSAIRSEYKLRVGIPSKLLDGFAEQNRQLFAARPPELTGSLNDPLLAQSTQKLEATDALIQWARHAPRTPVTMLNLLAFQDGMHSTYLRYGAAFSKSIGARRGGRAKLVGRVVPSGSQQTGWDEIALAHYPSAIHFADMAASQDYQAVNREHRLPALRDTTILCFVDFDLDELAASPRAKL